MRTHSNRHLSLSLLTSLFAIACGGHAAPDAARVPLLRLLEGAERIEIQLPETGGEALALYAFDATSPVPETIPGSPESKPLWLGVRPEGEGIQFDRFSADSVDRVFQKFQLYRVDGGEPLGDYQWVISFPEPSQAVVSLRQERRLKGLTTIQSIDDAKELGVERTGINILLNALIELQPGPDTPFIEVDGQPVYYNAGYLRSLDRQLREYADNDIAVTGVLLNHLNREGGRRHDALVHPDTAIHESPLGYGAFNTRTPTGMRTFRAAVDLLIERYTRADRRFGTLSGMVVGNEVNIHWVWHNQGVTEDSIVIRDYELALRSAWMSAQLINPEFKVYLSAEHNWNQRGFGGDATKEMGALALFEGLNVLAKTHGNFGWHVAYHPYPEDLTEPAFWNDRKAQFYFDTRVISFQNLEVLVEFLRKDDFLYKGESRHIALTEQGFHFKQTEEDADIQAAALAYTFKKIERMPAIEMFLLHRHVDHPNEGGLRLGLRAYDADDANGMGLPRKAWDVFQAFQTPDEAEVFEFALDYIGLAQWEDIPLRPEIGEQVPVGEEVAGAIFDFVQSIDEAQVNDAVVFRKDETIVSGGWLAPAIFHHPPQQGTSIASWNVQLPDMLSGESLVLQFATALKSDSSPDGVLYKLSVNGRAHFEHIQTDSEVTNHEVNLSPYAGQSVQIEFSVDPGASFEYDWSLWVAPKIVQKEKKP